MGCKAQVPAHARAAARPPGRSHSTAPCVAWQWGGTAARHAAAVRALGHAEARSGLVAHTQARLGLAAAVPAPQHRHAPQHHSKAPSVRCRRHLAVRAHLGRLVGRGALQQQLHASVAARTRGAATTGCGPRAAGHAVPHAGACMQVPRRAPTTTQQPRGSHGRPCTWSCSPAAAAQPCRTGPLWPPIPGATHPCRSRGTRRRA